ncbi:complement C3 isoform X1 [Dermacentor silvarum]|uniref:complement C3 isoform X2 n=1 Tax=Dermacentor silvarum TaxID=543639 RepID=UPI0018982718|nr:complement C3 isoform X2 [Dermacentor silvarum]XP_049513752.1 complement C3 isoform X1 [Dermacentor silvarum]
MSLSVALGGLWVLWLFLVLVAPTQSCMVIAPREVRPGVEETIVVFNRESPNDVTLTLQDYPKRQHTIFRDTISLGEGESRVVRIWIDPDKLDTDQFRWGRRHYVSLMVACGQVYTKEARLPVSSRSGYLLLQSDKPIYTPRQTAHFRAIAVGEDLVPTAGELKLQIMNPQGVVTYETSLSARDNTTTATGMFSHSYPFPASPMLGMWTAVVSYGFRLSQKTNITFELQEYVLPTFSARIAVPSVILPDSNLVTVTVEAKYPYGKPVQGSATCQFKIRDRSTGAERTIGTAMTKELVQGEVTFDVPNYLLWGWSRHRLFHGSRLVVEADVLDKATSERVTAVDDSAVYATSPYLVSFHHTDRNFKPGGPKTVKADIKHANGRPAALVPCAITAESDQGLNVPVDPDVTATDSRGRIAFNVLTEGQHNRIVAMVRTLLPSDPHQQATGQIYMEAFTSQVNAVIFLESADAGRPVKVGGDILLRVGIYPPTSSPAYYLVTHNGQVKRTGVLRQADHSTSFYRFERFSVTSDMSPAVRVLTFSFHEGHHLLVDSIVIDVEEACSHTAAITVQPDFKSDRPGSNGSVKILGSSGTRVGILGVDKQVYTLTDKDGLLTSDKLFAKLKSHDMGCGPGGGRTTADVLSNFGVVIVSNQSPDVVHANETSCQRPSRHRRSLGQVDQTTMSKYALDPFLKECCSLGTKRDRAGRSCPMRSAIVRRYISGQKGEQCADAFEDCCSHTLAGFPGPRYPGVYFSLARPDPPLHPGIESRIKPVPTFDEVDGDDDVLPPASLIRKDFRETWLFDEHVIGPDGVADIAVSLPHSITTWSVQAVSVSPSGGVCVPEPREVRVFQSVFLQVAVPYKVVRNEQIEVLATVYNYGNETIRGNVYVFGVEGICAGAQEGERSERRTVSVAANSASSIAFPVVPLREGRFVIKVHVHCPQGEDVVEKELNVVPEGVPVETVVSVPIDPANARKRTVQRSTTETYDDSVDPVTNQQTIAVNVLSPPDAVPGTRSCSLSLTGNQLGSSAEETLGKIEVLMKMPSGSGEENAVLMAQTLYALEYLERRNVTDRALEERGRRYLRDGYQRQLSFRSKTGFFSKFENTPPGSLWLTAFVTRTLCKARQYASIDDSVILSGLWWLLTQQKSRGVFREEWPYGEENILGTEDKFTAMTAFVFITFVECKPFIEEKMRLVMEVPEGAPMLNVSLVFLTSMQWDSFIAVRTNQVAQAVLHHMQETATYLSETAFGNENAHATALAAYAMTRGNVTGKDGALSALRQKLTHEPLQNTRSTGGDANPYVIEGTSYALLALLASGNSDHSDTDIIQTLVNWLNTHRPLSGTSSSTHDSAVALQALMEFDVKSSEPEVDLMCDVTMSGQQDFHKSIRIRPHNAAVPQQVDIRDMSGMLVVTANGTGSGLLSVRMKYNVLLPPEVLCKFNITVRAGIHTPKVKSAILDDFPAELLNELLGLDRERRSVDLDSLLRGSYGTAGLPNEPQQSKLVYDIEVCSQYVGESDSNAAVIEVGLLSGFDPVAEDLDAAIKENPNLAKYVLTEKKVILYFKMIPWRAPTCVKFRTERKHVVRNIQSAAVKVYDHSDPSRSCTQFYGIGSTSPLHKLACEGNKCRCIEAECPRREPFLNVESVIPVQIKRQMLLEMACKEHDFVWIATVSGNSVVNGFRHLRLRVTTVLKEGAEKSQSVLTDSKLFLAPHHCTTADLSEDVRYFVFGRDGEPFAKNGSVGVRYNMDKHVRLFNTQNAVTSAKGRKA